MKKKEIELLDDYIRSLKREKRDLKITLKISNKKLAQAEKDLHDVTEKYRRLYTIINKIG